MKKVFFKKNSHYYWPSLLEDQVVGILEVFFMTDVGSDSNNWISWLNNPQSSCASGNAINVIKQESDLILLEEVFSDDGPYFAIKKQKLIELLKKWNELMKQQPNYIVITMDGDDITMEGIDITPTCDVKL